MFVPRWTAGLAVALLLNACAPSPTGSPSTAPSTAASIAVASASSPPTTRPEETSTPTTKPTTKPSPSPALKQLAEVFASKQIKVAWTTLTAAEQELYARHPEFESIVPRWNLIDQNLADCGGVQPGIQRDACGHVVWQDYLLYKASGGEDAFAATVLAYQWALGLGISKAWLDAFVTGLVDG